MAPPVVPSPQKRQASVSNASVSNKRTRSVSISIKFNHGAITEDLPGSRELTVVTKNPQACLGDIPEELLLHIMKSLYLDPTVLANLRLTDQRCKRVAEEVLYKSVLGRSFTFNETQWVASNSVLAKHVRHFDVEFGDTSVWPGVHYQGVPVNGDFTRLTYNKLLANAHNLQTIVLQEHEGLLRTDQREELPSELGWLELFNNAITQSANGIVNRLTHLKKLMIITELVSVEEISCVFHLPSLQSLSLRNVHQTTPFEDWSVPSSSSPIKDISLTDGMMDSSAVVQMILSVKSLRKFVYHDSTQAWEPFGDQDSPMSILPEFSWKLLGDALRTHRHTLEELHAFKYCDQAVMDIVYPNGRDVGTLGSFKDFPMLQRCGTPIEAFLHTTTNEDDLSIYLPSHLRYWGTRITLATPKLLERYVPALASLRDVVRVGRDRTVRAALSDDLPIKALKLSHAFAVLEKAGINLDIYYNHAIFTVNRLRQLEAGTREDNSDEDSEGD